MAPAATQTAELPRAQPPAEGEAAERQNQISLPIFIMMLEFGVLMDLADLIEFIPIVGTIIALFMSAITGLILGLLMWVAGARSARQLITMVTGYIAEAIPFLSVLPLNTVMVILVYLMGTQKVSQVLERAPGLAKKLPPAPAT